MSKNKPIHEIRLHSVKAAIWENSVGETTRHSVTFSRLYKDGNEWKHTESYGREDLLVLSKLADLAHSWVCEHRQTK